MITLEKIREITSRQKNHSCIIDKGVHYTWQQILTQTESRVIFLKKMYNEENLRSASYLSKNNVEVICWLAAFTTLGIPINGLDYSLPVDKLTPLIKKIKPDILLVSYSLYSSEELNQLNTSGSAILAIDSLSDPIIMSIGEYYAPKIDMLLEGHISPPFRGVSLTSGTSSLPKIALRYQSFDARRFAWFSERYGFRNDDGFLLILPLYHAAGNGWARMFMGLGSPIYIVDQDDDEHIISTLSQKNVTASVMTPNLVNKLIQLNYNGEYQFYLRWILVGGSYFSVKSKHAAINLFGPIFYEYYGCTESGVNVLSEPEDIALYPSSVGRAFEGNQVIVIDEDFHPVKEGVSGRIAVASYMLMDEYSDGNRPFHLIDGVRYFLMSDHGYMDKQGRLFLLNRNGDNNNFDPLYSVEENIRALPCVSDVAVISVMEDGNNNIKCIFSTKQDTKSKAGNLMNKIIEEFESNSVNNIKAKKVESIPYSPSGKVRFNEVLRMLSAA